MSDCAGTGCSPFTPCQHCLARAFEAMTDPLAAFEQTSPRPHGGTVTRHVDDDGRLHDTGDEPALCERSRDGVVRYELHAIHGVETDIGFTPAHRWNYPDGAPHVIEHMHGGLLHDHVGPYGFVVPAIAWFTPSGVMMRAESWLDGVRQTA